ncbi:aminoacyl-tRNA hydrolase, partial [Candidatus Gracilibacteria bacterium]|nr:aminoacyl-tRNA hydrolase [Candidatus Gracilibacteria bacterium]
MKILVGLGNPGKKYENTRHNVGFSFLDFFAKKNNFGDFKDEKKFFGEISEGNIGGEKVILLKPQTFMNLSGKSVQAILNFYKIDFEDFFVIYDDKDLDFGKIRFREKGSSGGH